MKRMNLTTAMHIAHTDGGYTLSKVEKYHKVATTKLGSPGKPALRWLINLRHQLVERDIPAWLITTNSLHPATIEVEYEVREGKPMTGEEILALVARNTKEVTK